MCWSDLCTSLMMMWLNWLIDGSGHSKNDRLSVHSWMGRLHLTMFLFRLNTTSSRVQLFVPPRTNTNSDSSVLNMWSFSLLCSLMTLIQVLSWDLVLELDFNLLTGTNELNRILQKFYYVTMVGCSRRQYNSRYWNF